MAAVFSLIIILSLSLLVVRIATVALTLTGVSYQLARFQAQSAFTGVGYTTTEAERIVRHPVRRRIAQLLMLLGNVGVVTAISSLILSFVDVQKTEMASRVLFLLLGIAAVWAIATSRWIEHELNLLIRWALRRWTRLEIVDYANLLRLSGDYGVREMQVQKGDWVTERPLRELDLTKEGMLVLGILRGEEDNYYGAPRPDTVIHAGDTLILYGRDDNLEELDERREGTGGDEAHERAMARQDKETAKERRREKRQEKRQRQREQEERDERLDQDVE